MNKIDEYKEMAKGAESMESKIRKHLEQSCPNYDPKKFDKCIEYLVSTASTILDGESGEVPDEVCYKICRDFFNDGESDNVTVDEVKEEPKPEPKKAPELELPKPTGKPEIIAEQMDLFG